MTMDPSDGSTRMNDITATYKMDITQTGSQIQIVFYTYPTSYRTDTAYWNEYGMAGVPPVSGGDILFKGTVSGASFTADEYPASSLTQEHLVGTFTTDIITATLSGLLIYKRHQRNNRNTFRIIRNRTANRNRSPHRNTSPYTRPAHIN